MQEKSTGRSLMVIGALKHRPLNSRLSQMNDSSSNLKRRISSLKPINKSLLVDGASHYLLESERDDHKT